MGRVHQSDDGVVDVALKIHPLHKLGRAADDAAEDGRLSVARRGPGVGRHIDEHKPLALLDGVGADADPLRLQRLIVHEGGNGRACSVLRSETPAVVRALHGFAPGGVRDQSTGRQGRGPMRTDVAQGEGGAAARAAQKHRLPKKVHPLKSAGLQLAGQGGEIPEVVQEPLAESGGGFLRLQAGGWGGQTVMHGPSIPLSVAEAKGPLDLERPIRRWWSRSGA